MKISIIVPAYNEAKLIGESLRHIREASQAFLDRRWEVELIVCDNNSTDQTATIARAAGATVVFEGINQIGRARNAGASAATGDWFIFVDADSHPSHGLFEDVADQIQGGRCLAGGTIVRLDHSHRWGDVGIRFWNRLSRTLKWMAGSFIFCEAAAFRELGGFSLDLYVSEELDLTRRLKKAARLQKKQIVILDRHPLVTSDRKFHLYKPREHFWFLAKTILMGGRTFKNKARCPIWYDGRR